MPSIAGILQIHHWEPGVSQSQRFPAAVAAAAEARGWSFPRHWPEAEVGEHSNQMKHPTGQFQSDPSFPGPAAAAVSVAAVAPIGSVEQELQQLDLTPVWRTKIRCPAWRSWAD